MDRNGDKNYFSTKIKRKCRTLNGTETEQRTELSQQQCDRSHGAVFSEAEKCCCCRESSSLGKVSKNRSSS
ncbi:hypothetical protein E2C01_095554 [Portunus trituberculatus]|uniref:Uncharacterized protein n=1 Tax=Portunus trituberculatus TaxID=210409 RepID=A0A5B7K0G6_PORTR|nr:hypothetical protein [Portunus trituberculatus]